MSTGRVANKTKTKYIMTQRDDGDGDGVRNGGGEEITARVGTEAVLECGRLCK